MQNNQDKMAQMFGAPPKTFIPPYNNINADTLTACRNVGFKFMSSEVGQDPPPYPIDGNFLRWPILPATGVTDTPDSHYVPGFFSKSSFSPQKFLFRKSLPISKLRFELMALQL